MRKRALNKITYIVTAVMAASIVLLTAYRIAQTG